MKICARCNATKPFDAFHRNCQSKDGLQSYCKVCRSELHKIYRSKPEVHKAIVEKIRCWRNNHGREKYLAYRREYDKSFKRTLWRRVKYNSTPRKFKNKPTLHPDATLDLYVRIKAIRKIIADNDFEAYSTVPDLDKNTCNAWKHVSDEELERRINEQI